MNISSLSFSYHFPSFYNKLHISTNLSYTPNQEQGFEWVYDFDFLIVSEITKKTEHDSSIPLQFSENYRSIHSYLSNSEKFKKTFKLIYRSNISNIEIIELYQNKNLN